MPYDRAVNRCLATATILLSTFAGTIALHAQSAAQTPTEAELLLAKATSLRCTFPMSVRTTWKEGAPQPVLRTTTRLTITIRNINAASGSAVLVTGSGAKDITLVADAKNLHFLDAGGGRVTVTTVLGEFSSEMKFMAAHAIHDYTALDLGSFKVEPEVVQHWGNCENAPPEP